MNIYAELKKDHRKLERLLDQLVKSSERGKKDWRALVSRIRDELIPHSRAEEALFYNAIRDAKHGRGVIVPSYADHAMAEADLRALQAMEAIDTRWTALARKFRADLLRHVEEEESKVFAAGKTVFTAQDAEKVGKAFVSLKPWIRTQTLAGTSIDLVLNLLPDGMRSRLRTALADSRKKSA